MELGNALQLSGTHVPIVTDGKIKPLRYADVMRLMCLEDALDISTRNTAVQCTIHVDLHFQS